MNFRMNEIFLDKSGQYVMYDARHDRYLQLPEKKLKQYNAFRNRLTVSAAIGVLIPTLFKVDWYWGLGSAVIIYMIFSYIYYQKLIPQLKELKNYDPVKNKRPERKETKGATIFKGSLYLLCSVLLFISLTMTDNEPLSRIALILVATFALAAGIHAFVRLNDNYK